MWRELRRRSISVLDSNSNFCLYFSASCLSQCVIKVRVSQPTAASNIASPPRMPSMVFQVTAGTSHLKVSWSCCRWLCGFHRSLRLLELHDFLQTLLALLSGDVPILHQHLDQPYQELSL